MNHCQKGRELLMDLKRSDFLPAYDDEGIRIILAEMSDIHNKLIEITNEHEEGNYPDGVKVTLVYYHQCLNRNKRYLNSYLTFRMGKVKSLRWETGTVLPDRIKHDTLSLRENTYFSNYSNILSEYCEDIGFDLTSDIEPPKELLIEIRVLIPCGEIMTDKGPVNLSQVGDTQFLRRSDVELLIRHGRLEQVQYNTSIV